MSTMQSIPLDSGVLAFPGALDVAPTGSGLIPRRLPAWTRPQITDMAMEAVVQLPAGVRLALTTSATTVEIDVLLTLIRQVPRELRPAVFDLLVDGALVAQSATATGSVISLGPGRDDVAFEPGPSTTISFTDLPRGTKAVEIWLPAHAAVEFRAVRLDEGAVIERTVPTLPRWIHYGSSISHCVGATSPVKTWPDDPRLGRRRHQPQGGGQHHRRGRHAPAPFRTSPARLPRHHQGRKARHTDPRGLSDFLPEQRGPCRAADARTRRSRRGRRGPPGDAAHQPHHARNAISDRIGRRGAARPR